MNKSTSNVGTDSRKITRRHIHAKATLVTHDAEAKRLFGMNWKYMTITGYVKSMEYHQTKKRRMVYLNCAWAL